MGDDDDDNDEDEDDDDNRASLSQFQGSSSVGVFVVGIGGKGCGIQCKEGCDFSTGPTYIPGRNNICSKGVLRLYCSSILFPFLDDDENNNGLV